jgi:protein involved in polysaccharide export with SLBB domain
MVERKRPQLNVLLSDRDRWVLDLIAAARGVTVAEIARDQIAAFIRKQEDRPAVARLIAAAVDLQESEVPPGTTVIPMRRRSRTKP